MQIERIFLAFLSEPTYEQARIAGLKELLKHLEIAHYSAELENMLEDSPGLAELIEEVQQALSKAQQFVKEDQ